MEMDFEALAKAIEDRDDATVKKLAAIETKADGLAAGADGLKEQLAALEQKLARRGQGGGGGSGEGKTVGEQFIESENVKAFLATPHRRGKVDLQLKTTLTSLTTDAAGSVGAMGVAHRDEPSILPRRRLTIRNLIPSVRITAGSVEVPVQKARTLNAGMVAEGAAKPGSDIQFELKTFPARTIAHWMKASRQVLDDVPQLRGIVDTELLYGLGLKEESQLLDGDNTGQNLYGMVPQATAYAAPIVITDLNKMDVIGLALLQSSLAEFPPDGVIMHPSDWMEMRLAKDGTGRYIFGDPGTVVQPRLFGLPVVATQAMTIDKFLVGQFQVAATIFDRWDARVEVATENEDDFIKNLVTVLGEERLAFAVKRPAALFYGDFSDALAA